MKIKDKRAPLSKPKRKSLSIQLRIKHILFYALDDRAQYSTFHLRNERHKVWRIKSS